MGTLYILDSGGNVASQSADSGALPSWINHWYVDPPGTTSSINQSPIHFASTWAGIIGGSHSGTSASVQQSWYPPLPSCHDPRFQNLPCPQPYDALTDALTALRTLLSQQCTACVNSVFNIVGGTQENFNQFVNLVPYFWDGTKSNAPLSVLCGEAAGVIGFINYHLLCSNPKVSPNCAWVRTVSQLMSCMQDTAVTVTPSWAHDGISTYFDPSTVGLTSASTPQGILSQAVLFHEGLHGYFGVDDLTLLGDFNKDSDSPSCQITNYLELTIWGGTLNACGN